MGWVFYAVLSAVLAGLVAIFGKVGIRGVDNTLATAVRAGVMFGVLVLLLLARGTLGEVRRLSWHPLLFILLSGLAGAGSWLCYFRALQFGDALRVAPIDRMSGAVILILAALVLHERAPVSAWIGTGLMLIGAVMVARS